MDRLFSGTGSHSVTAFPVRAVYNINERARGDVPVQVLVSVSKRFFKHAVDRNRIKRQLREAYRHQRELLSSLLPEDKSVAVAFIWISPHQSLSCIVEKRMGILLQRIASVVSAESPA